MIGSKNWINLWQSWRPYTGDDRFPDAVYLIFCIQNTVNSVEDADLRFNFL
jgi:hypothetical protein